MYFKKHEEVFMEDNYFIHIDENDNADTSEEVKNTTKNIISSNENVVENDTLQEEEILYDENVNNEDIYKDSVNVSNVGDIISQEEKDETADDDVNEKPITNEQNDTNYENDIDSNAGYKEPKSYKKKKSVIPMLIFVIILIGIVILVALVATKKRVSVNTNTIEEDAKKKANAMLESNANISQVETNKVLETIMEETIIEETIKNTIIKETITKENAKQNDETKMSEETQVETTKEVIKETEKVKETETKKQQLETITNVVVEEVDKYSMVAPDTAVQVTYKKESENQSTISYRNNTVGYRVKCASKLSLIDNKAFDFEQPISLTPFDANENNKNIEIKASMAKTNNKYMKAVWEENGLAYILETYELSSRQEFMVEAYKFALANAK